MQQRIEGIPSRALSPESKRLMQRMVRGTEEDQQNRIDRFASSVPVRTQSESYIYMNREPSAIRNIKLNNRYDPESYDPINEPFFRRIRLRRLYQDPIPWEYYLHADDEPLKSNLERIVPEQEEDNDNEQQTSSISKKVICSQDVAIQTVKNVTVPKPVITKRGKENRHNNSTSSIRNSEIHSNVQTKPILNTKKRSTVTNTKSTHSTILKKKHTTIPKLTTPRKKSIKTKNSISIIKPRKLSSPPKVFKKPPIPKFAHKVKRKEKDLQILSNSNSRTRSPVVVIRPKSPISIHISGPRSEVSVLKNDSEMNYSQQSEHGFDMDREREQMIDFIRKSLSSSDVSKKSSPKPEESIIHEDEFEDISIKSVDNTNNTINASEMEDRVIEQVVQRSSPTRTRSPSPKKIKTPSPVASELTSTSKLSSTSPQKRKKHKPIPTQLTRSHPVNNNEKIVHRRHSTEIRRVKSPIKKKPPRKEVQQISSTVQRVKIHRNDSAESYINAHETKQYNAWMDEYIDKLTDKDSDISLEQSPKRISNMHLSPKKLTYETKKYNRVWEESEDEFTETSYDSSDTETESDTATSVTSASTRNSKSTTSVMLENLKYVESESERNYSESESSSSLDDGYESSQLEELEALLEQQHKRLLDRGYIKKKVRDDSSAGTGATTLLQEVLEDISSDEDSL